MYESMGRFEPEDLHSQPLGNSIPSRVTQGDTRPTHDGPIKAKSLLFFGKPTLASSLLRDCRPRRADLKAPTDKKQWT